MKPEELDAIRKRAEAATPGPWDIGPMLKPIIITGHEHTVWPIAGSGVGVACIILPKEDDTPDDRRICKGNREFIAHAREDIPALLAEVERLQDRIMQLEMGENY